MYQEELIELKVLTEFRIEQNNSALKDNQIGGYY